MNSDDRPSSCSGLQRRPAVGRCSQRQASPMAAIITPSRMKKKLDEVVQKLDCTQAGGGRKDVLYAAKAMTRPVRPKPMLTRRSASGLRAPSSITPVSAPAVRKAVHGKNVKLVRPGMARG